MMDNQSVESFSETWPNGLMLYTSFGRGARIDSYVYCLPAP
jgi:hypothetical protein